jgi:hypothetical protein
MQGARDEAVRRGAWDGFRRPRDNADRLRKSVPYKYKASCVLPFPLRIRSNF